MARTGRPRLNPERVQTPKERTRRHRAAAKERERAARAAWFAALPEDIRRDLRWAYEDFRTLTALLGLYVELLELLKTRMGLIRRGWRDDWGTRRGHVFWTSDQMRWIPLWNEAELESMVLARGIEQRLNKLIEAGVLRDTAERAAKRAAERAAEREELRGLLRRAMDEGRLDEAIEALDRDRPGWRRRVRRPPDNPLAATFGGTFDLTPGRRAQPLTL